MKRKILFLFLLIFMGLNCYSQERCGSIRNLEKIKKENPKLYKQIMELEKFTQNYINSLSEIGILRQEQLITIPVVVHVVYHTTVQNISNNQINSQITVLNQDYRRTNADTSNTPSEFRDEAADIEIEFYLACHDPEGSPTSGITRTYTDSTQWSTNNNMKYTATGGHDAWDTEEYLNIWVCNLEYPYLGYAQFPGGDPETDGVAVDYQAFGTTGTAQYPYDKGRTATHEVGHWLNLYHIWGDDQGACSGSDFCDDTPNQGNYYYGCPNHPQTSCSSHDMFMNYLDYTNDACMNLFTQDQRDRMRALFSSGGARESFVIEDMYITGPDLVCSSPNSTFTLHDRPSGTTVDWTPSYNLIEVTGDGTDNYTVKASPYAKEPGWVEATVSSDCPDRVVRENIDWVGVPDPTIDGNIYPECFMREWYFLEPDDMWGTYYWHTDYKLRIIGSRYGYKALVEPLEGGTGQIFCDVTNTCGTGYGRLVVYISCRGFKMSPNPADDYVEISIDESKLAENKIGEYEVRIYNGMNIMVSQIRTRKPTLRINTRQFVNGIYTVHFITGDKVQVEQLVISH